jgi:hypothetical protein
MMEEPEYQWARKPSNDIPGVPTEDVPLERVGSLNSIPRDKSPFHQEDPNESRIDQSTTRTELVLHRSLKSVPVVAITLFF